MAKVYAPNKHYTGISANVVFKDGVGETSDPHLLNWFKSRGYAVEEDPKKVEKTNPEPVNAGAEEPVKGEQAQSPETKPGSKSSGKSSGKRK